MAKKNGRQRINIFLPSELSKKFDAYCIAYLSKKGFVNDVKPKIVRAAVEEFLQKHAQDFDIKL